MKQFHVNNNNTEIHFTISEKRLFIMIGMLSVKCNLTDLNFNDEKCIVTDDNVDLLLEQENYQLLKDTIMGEYKANTLFANDCDTDIESEARQYLDK